MSSYSRRIFPCLIFFLVLIILLAACSKSALMSTATQPLPSLTSTSTATLLPPTATPTPVPLAAIVNGEAIPLSDYLAELARYQSALNNDLATSVPGTNLATQDKQRVMDDLIDQTLLAQGAAQEGYKMDEAAVQTRLENLTAQVGGAQALSTWESAQGFTDDSFRQALQRAMAAAWMRDQIVSSVPEFVEQVHARQILLYNESDANQVLSRIEAGFRKVI
jgi:peptidyl-prolyl cis-trans isomerase C